MGEFLVYILKLAACLTMFFVFYMLLLSRETFHRSNRLTLLAIMLLSAALPLVKWTPQASEPLYLIAAGAWDLPDILPDILPNILTDEMPEEAGGGSLASAWIVLAYIIGAALFLVHNIISILKIRGIMRSGVKRKAGKGLTLILTQWHVPPFSWFNNVVINPADLEENGEAIIAHERAHVELRHSLDMALATICVALQWFNPAAWLLMRELRIVHEYEADEQVLKQGIDAKSYQLLLISKAVGRERFVAVASSFRSNKLKKRISMMLKNRSNVIARLKYACILPLSALAIAVFARPEVAASLEVISNVSVPNLFVTAQDTVIRVAPQKNTITLPDGKADEKADEKAEANADEKFETTSDMSISHSMDVEVEIDDFVTVADSIRENVRIMQIDDTVIVQVNNAIDTIVVSANPEKEIQMEVRELRRRAVREGVRVSRELEKWREEHADEIEAVKKQAEALGKKAAAETRKALKDADKARKDLAQEWRDERARQIRADSLRNRGARSDSFRVERDNRRAELDRRRAELDRRRELPDSLRREFAQKRRTEIERRREEFKQRRDDADRRKEELEKEKKKEKEKEKDKEKAMPENVAYKTDLREMA
ncbi:MAG: hypothetical protein LBD28_00455 [Tannerellaceae bacterium]|jgi:hypothetical protein|nr:hypothetical protein [Tannerellaceae bacterium]